MGGPITNIFNPVQSIRTARGHLTDALPRWMPLRNWIASKRYACIMLQASVEQFESIPEFIEKGGKVIIDSVYSFEVSAWLVTGLRILPLSSSSSIYRTRRRHTDGSRVDDLLEK
jgi:hypothetical protein